jgi:hypothetical protein
MKRVLKALLVVITLVMVLSGTIFASTKSPVSYQNTVKYTTTTYDATVLGYDTGDTYSNYTDMHNATQGYGNFSASIGQAYYPADILNQETQNSYNTIGYFGLTDWNAEKYLHFPYATISKLSFYLEKTDTLDGTLYARIRDVDGNLIKEFGAGISADSLTTDFAWYDFTDTWVNTSYRTVIISIECDGGTYGGGFGQVRVGYWDDSPSTPDYWRQTGTNHYCTYNDGVFANWAAGVTTGVLDIKVELDGPIYEAFRSYLAFDTSSLPSITGLETIQLILRGYADNSDLDFAINIQTGYPDYPHNPINLATDYGLTAYPIGTFASFNTSGWDAGGDNIITIDPTNGPGSYFLNPGGWTKCMLVSGNDLAGDEAPGSDEYVSYTFGGAVHVELTVTSPDLVVTTLPATKVTSGTATLNGSLDDLAGASNADVYFEWGDSISYGQTTTSQNLTAIGNFSFNISSLTSGVIYHFRAVGYDGTTTVYGVDRTLITTTTGGVASGLDMATPISGQGGLTNGQLNGNPSGQDDINNNLLGFD